MAPKELNRHQLSSKLSYAQSTPAFLLKFKNRVAGLPDDEDEDDFDAEFEDDGSGRPPIPRRPRPAIPERPLDDPGSADEDDADEKPQVVVLREGKHLTEREADNIRREEKGLPPLPDPAESSARSRDSAPPCKNKQDSKNKTSLSFSSSKGGVKSSNAKRKAMEEPATKADKCTVGPTKKKAKKASKTLLSFGDDA